MPEARSPIRDDPSEVIASDPDANAGSRSTAWNLRSAVALILVVLISTTLMFIYHNRFWAPADEGIYAHVAERILRGQVLHRDVQDLHAGYVDFVNATAFSVFGLRLVSMRYPLALLTVIQAGLMFLVLRRRRSGYRLDWRRGTYLTQLRSVSESNRQLVYLVSRRRNHRLAVVGSNWSAVAPCRYRVARRHSLSLSPALRRLPRLWCSGVSAFGETPGLKAIEGRRLARAILALIAMGNAWYILRVTDPVGWVLFGVWPLAVFAVGLAANEAIRPGGARAPA